MTLEVFNAISIKTNSKKKVLATQFLRSTTSWRSTYLYQGIFVYITEYHSTHVES